MLLINADDPVRRSIRLVCGTNQQFVEVQLVDLAPSHLEDFDVLWVPQLRQCREEDKYWDWRFKKRLAMREQGHYEGYALEFENRAQGLLLLESQSKRSQIQPGQPLVYVSAIAAAPWNRRAIQRPPYLLGVGTALLDFARQRSLELGYRGRVGLHALPRAVKFYERLGMTEVPPDPDEYIDPEDEPLTYFEYREIHL